MTLDVFCLSRRRVLAGFGLATASIAFEPQRARAETTLERAKRTGTITLGIANERPYAFVETDGRVTGAIPEVLRTALEPQGIKKLEASIVDFNALIPGVNAERFDVIGAGMYIRPVRCQAVSFTNPITRAGGAFASKKGNPKGVRSIADVAAHANAIVGTQSGTAQIEELAAAGVPRDRTVLFARVDEALAGLQAGRVDVIYFPALQINELLATAKDPNLERVEGFKQIIGKDGQPAYNYQAFGLRKSDDDLRSAINAEIARMLSDGRLLKIISQYGYGADELPSPEVTAERLCTAV